MAADDSVLRAADEIAAVARRNNLTEICHFGDLFEAFEIAMSRVFGRSVQHLVRQEELRLMREIHHCVTRPVAVIDFQPGENGYHAR